MPKIDLDAAPHKTGSLYPEPYASMVAGRWSLRLGPAGGLTQFGANIVVLDPGAQSSLMHAHSAEDEFVIVLSGECVLETQHGEWVMRPGDCAAFPAGGGELHHFLNRTGSEARFLVVGTRAAHDVVSYAAEVDLRIVTEGGRSRILHRDGTPYEERG